MTGDEKQVMLDEQDRQASNELDIAAEEAYLKFTQQKQDDNDDGDFDFDEEACTQSHENDKEDGLRDTLNVPKSDCMQEEQLDEETEMKCDVANTEDDKSKSRDAFCDEVGTEHLKTCEPVEEESSSEVDEWEGLDRPLATQDSTDSKSITIQETLDYFKKLDIGKYSDKIRPCVVHTGFNAFWCYLTGPPKLNARLIHGRDLLFSLALTSFENSDEVHGRVLQSIYKRLTGKAFDCPRFGGHWETIGFQGNDPSTDLRGCGILGLITMLHFILSPATCKIAKSIYVLSQDSLQHFPFCIVSINLTRIALQILREGKLNKLCNRQLKDQNVKYAVDPSDAVFDVFQELYVAIYYSLYRVWRDENKTMLDSGFVLKELECEAKSKPLCVMRRYTEACADEPQYEKVDSFVGVENLREVDQ